VATAPSPSLPTAPRNLWIVSPWADALLVIGAPLLIAPLLYLAVQVFAPELVAGFVLGVLATGHHLPGFLRAYGDPVLFRHFRMRFLLAPPLCFLMIFWFTWNEMHGAAALVAIWSIWHGFMQVYGFMRIYDAKAGENSAATRRLDWLVCAVGFVAILLWSEGATSWIVRPAEVSGLYFFPLLFGEAARATATTIAVGVGIVYVAYTAWKLYRGHPIAPAKLILLGISLGFLYFSWVLMGSAVLLGLAAFEAFHDIQYLAIVWANNRRIVEKGSASPALSRLFRPGAALVLLYIALCLAYGAAANTEDYFASRFVVSGIISLGLTSAVMHFYFDGFIWKVRQTKTRDDLGIPVTSAAAAGSPPASGNQRRLEIRQLVYLTAPFALLAGLGLYASDLEIPMREVVVRLQPGSSDQQLQLGIAYQQRQRHAEASEHLRAAIALDPELAPAHYHLAGSLAAQKRVPEAIEEYRAALAADPDLTSSSVVLANLLIARQRPLEAVTVLRAALARSPDNWMLMDRLARALLAAPSDDTRTREAMKLAQEAAQLAPPHRAVEPTKTLAEAMAAQGRYAVAVSLLEKAQEYEASRGAQAPEIQRPLTRYRLLKERAAAQRGTPPAQGNPGA
jgi:tetratricopeptide (TPR) repeat protein